MTMNNSTSPQPNYSYQAFHIAMSGFLALVVAMGIGRFTFTPQVPLMIAESQISLTGAGIVAAFNYLGYLAGSYDAMRARRFIEYRLWAGLVGSGHYHVALCTAGWADITQCRPFFLLVGQVA